MKSLTIRIPDALAADIEAECRRRHISKSDLVRKRLESASGSQKPLPGSLKAIAHLCGSLAVAPADLSARRKHYLKALGYGQKRPR